ncbi:hypothetical protein GH714_022516 [Hevea brasiliensis]|uniref:Leucine-rich repeat-containing N-terminal plant-type domain-containing protein n=1 Tax=Hevea brasiliensis TaxID=3981 RepID=A0A6A6N3N4_HEVBR|nr:hypothetical protein GH714_022516 [Hevea brasiliensis]
MVAELPNLETLGLWMNNFTGEIPQKLGQNGKLHILDLSSNKLTEGLGTCYSLTRVRLGQNYLNGSIPNGFIYLPRLNLVELQNNVLSGNLSENEQPLWFSPPEISNIHILNYLNLSRNHLNQTIPKSIGSMKSLTVADFSFNDFSGKVPEFGQFSLFNASSFAGNPQLCGPYLTILQFHHHHKHTGKAPSDFKLIFALGLLICSLIFATAAIIKAKSFKKNSSDSWKMTAFQKLEFTVTEPGMCKRWKRNW